MKKIAVFVDVQNIYYTCRQAYGRQFNYRRFWQQLQHQGDIVQATAYAIDRADDQQRKFQDALRRFPDYGTVLIMLGEVDCSFALWHRAEMLALSG